MFILTTTFSYTAPTVWNKLPDDIRNARSVMSFRKQLKTPDCMSYPEVC